jgi:xanthosine utilization system XapX-like protein
MNSGQVAKFGCLVSLPLLRFGFQFLEKSPDYFGSQVTDVSGALLFARQLDSMGSPFENQTITGAPLGYPILGLLRLVLGFNTTFLWSLTRLTSPANALALYCLLGLLITGIATRWTARMLGASETGSLICAILAQSLPWLTEKSANHVTYCYCGLVLIPIGLTLRTVDSISISKFIGSIVAAICCLVIDPYLGVFALLGILLTIAFGHSSRSLRRGVQIGLVIAIVAGTFLDRGSLGAVDLLIKQLNSRGLGKDELILPARLSDYVTPQPGHLIAGGRNMSEVDRDFLADYVNYFGLVNLLLATLGIAISYRLKDHKWRTLSFVMLFFVIMSLQFNIGKLSWMPASSLWIIAPGLRVVSRYGLVAQLIAVVFLAIGIDWLLIKITYKQFMRPALVCAILIGSLVDTDPLLSLGDRANSESYSNLGSRLTNGDIVAILPDGPSRTSRWVGLASLLNSRISNSEIDSSILESLTEFVRNRQFEDAWCEAQRVGSTHILLVQGAEVSDIPDWEIDSSNLELEDPSLFSEVAQAISPVFHPEYQVKVSLFKIVKNQDRRSTLCN